MTRQISALELTPMDTVREVSPETINFYVDELSGIYLPEDFRDEHTEIPGVKYWKSTDRLLGKFGRYALQYRDEDEQKENPLDDILLMGTTIGLQEIDRYAMGLRVLRHYSLDEKIIHPIEKRGLAEKPISVDGADYGTTVIRLGSNGEVESISVGSSSSDFGRAEAEGRQRTCDLFSERLDGLIDVINSDPEPDKYDRIISSQN